MRADLLVCMPGTHCKWVSVADGAVAGFATWLTGELFSVLSTHSILRHALGADPAKVSPGNPVFQQWLDDGLAHPGDAVSRLFRIRASTLLLDMQPDAAAAALSGLLIGNEIASARQQFASAGSDIVLVASGGLGDLYAEALAPRRLYGRRRSMPKRPCAKACSKRRAAISGSTPGGGPRHERAVAKAQARHRRHPARPRAR